MLLTLVGQHRMVRSTDALPQGFLLQGARVTGASIAPIFLILRMTGVWKQFNII